MRKVTLTLGMAALIASASIATLAVAGDRPPTAAEASDLAKILNDAGFKSWRKIELDDGKWEVDDAVHQDGRVYDVDIRGGKIVKKDLED